VESERRREALLAQGRLLVDERLGQRLQIGVVGIVADPLVIDIGRAFERLAPRRAMVVLTTSTLGSPNATTSFTLVSMPRYESVSGTNVAWLTRPIFSMSRVSSTPYSRFTSPRSCTIACITRSPRRSGPHVHAAAFGTAQRSLRR